ncbi:hypothetical protein ACWDRW_38890, partial [Streptomyces sp. NPDC003635]
MSAQSPSRRALIGWGGAGLALGAAAAGGAGAEGERAGVVGVGADQLQQVRLALGGDVQREV